MRWPLLLLMACHGTKPADDSQRPPESPADSAPELETSLHEGNKGHLLDLLRQTDMDSGAVAYVRQQERRHVVRPIIVYRALTTRARVQVWMMSLMTHDNVVGMIGFTKSPKHWLVRRMRTQRSCCLAQR